MNPFATESTKEQPLELSVPELLALITPASYPHLTVRVAADGYLIALDAGSGAEKPVVTAWTGQGQGKSHGRPEKWRQNYWRAYSEPAAAERRFTDLITRHGGAAEGGDR